MCLVQCAFFKVASGIVLVMDAAPNKSPVLEQVMLAEASYQGNLKCSAVDQSAFSR